MVDRFTGCDSNWERKTLDEHLGYWKIQKKGVAK